ncbi:MAG: carboxy terminal-processing peptidase [Polyangiaceae bacterium]
MRRKALPLVLVSILVAACGSAKSGTPPKGSSTSSPPTGSASTLVVDNELPEVPADPREPILADAALALLGKQHVLRKPIDDALSRDAFQKLVEELDGGKVLFLEGHVQKLSRFENDIDNELREGNLVVARKGAALVAERRAMVAKLVKTLLEKPLDFTTSDSFETDPKKRAFCKTEAELEARWRSLLKLQVLERNQQFEDILESRAKPKDESKKPKDPDEAKREAIAERALGEIPATFEGREAKIRKELATRYETQFTRLKVTEKLEPAENLLNAVNAVFDPHTTYMPPAQEANFDIAITGKLEGIGATLREQDHYIVVHDLVPGGASWQQGKLEIGDLILAVAQEGKDPVDATDLPIDKVVSMIRGPKGTIVVLTVKKADGRIETISITRDVIRIEATYARGAVVRSGKNGEPVGYVYLPGFYGDVGGRGKPGERNATDDVRAILNALQKKKVTQLVLDLRGNGGGLLTHARDISGLFIPQGPVVQTRDSDGKIEVLADTDPSVSFSGNVVVLVDRFSASAAEILAGALQDYERAVVVGTSATHGKGTVQAVLDLDRMQAKGKEPLGLYKLTVQEYFRVSGGSTQLKGVVPDVLLPDPTSFVDSGERTLYHAIPWTSIKSAPYTKLAHTWKAPELASASEARTKASPELAAVAEFARILGARKDKTLEPLERKAWQDAKKAAKAELEKVDPKRKDRKVVLEVEALAASPAAGPAPTDEKIRARLDRWKDELARDVWVDECTRILADMAKAK